jgi:hypothetical protein
VPKYVIERDIPNAGSLTEHEIQAIAQKSCSVVQNLGPQIQWLHSYVTDDKIYPPSGVKLRPSERRYKPYIVVLLVRYRLATG